MSGANSGVEKVLQDAYVDSDAPPPFFGEVADQLVAAYDRGLDLTFPEDAAVIKTWANGGAVQTSTLVSQMRLWIRYLEEAEAAGGR